MSTSDEQTTSQNESVITFYTLGKQIREIERNIIKAAAQGQLEYDLAVQLVRDAQNMSLKLITAEMKFSAPKSQSEHKKRY